MKKFSSLNENFKECNPGNGMDLGVTNHYTPIQNILTNINNLFCSRLGIVATVSEDTISIKLTSSKFKNQKAVDDLLNMRLYNDSNYESATLANYIKSQGLTKVQYVNLGGYMIVYFSPADIKTEEPSSCDLCANNCFPCPCEMQESLNDEFEVTTVMLCESDDDEEEMKDPDVEHVIELLDNGNKVKAAKELEELVAQRMELPDEYYFAGVKFKSGEEAIALRWKYEKKLPHKDKVATVKSLFHIFGSGDEAVWIPDYESDSIIKLPYEVRTMIDNILDILGAQKTSDPAVYKITGERQERQSKKDDEEKKDNEDVKKEDENKKVNPKDDNTLDIDKK